MFASSIEIKCNENRKALDWYHIHKKASYTLYKYKYVQIKTIFHLKQWNCQPQSSAEQKKYCISFGLSECPKETTKFIRITTQAFRENNGIEYKKWNFKKYITKKNLKLNFENFVFASMNTMWAFIDFMTIEIYSLFYWMMAEFKIKLHSERVVKIIIKNISRWKIPIQTYSHSNMVPQHWIHLASIFRFSKR